MFSSTRPPIAKEMLSPFAPTITEKDNLHLCSISPESKVVQALSSLDSTKALGLDGFFFKKYWSVVKQDVLNYTINFFQNQ
jgi:hypothetical protein